MKRYKIEFTSSKPTVPVRHDDGEWCKTIDVIKLLESIRDVKHVTHASYMIDKILAESELLD